MGTPISKADPFSLPIPVERVTLRIANADIVSNNFSTTITTAHRLPFLQLRQPTRYMDILILLQCPLARLLPIVESDLTTPKHSPAAGYPSAEFDIASTPTTPTSSCSHC
jgi:hypothetical protein